MGRLIILSDKGIRLPQIPIEEEMDFNIFKLKFNIYELNDGSHLRLCEIPVKIFRTSKNINPNINIPVPDYLIMWNTILSALVPPDLKSTPSPELFDPKKDKMNPIDFIPLSEPFNFFDLSNGTRLKVRVLVERVFKAEKYNNLGEPVYWVTKKILTDVQPDTIRIDE